MTDTQKNKLNPTLWVDKYGDYLYHFAYNRLSSAVLAEDFVQETFLAAYRSRNNFKGKSSEKTWLVSILKNKVADHYRKKSKKVDDVSLDNSPFIQEKFMHGSWKMERVPQNWTLENQNLTEDEGFIKVLQECINRLPDKWKAVFSLKHVEEVKNNMICDELNVSDSNIWTILHRSRLQLRECIERFWFAH